MACTTGRCELRHTLCTLCTLRTLCTVAQDLYALGWRHVAVHQRPSVHRQSGALVLIASTGATSVGAYKWLIFAQTFGRCSAVALLLALGVNVQPSRRLRLHRGPTTQADLVDVSNISVARVHRQGMVYLQPCVALGATTVTQFYLPCKTCFIYKPDCCSGTNRLIGQCFKTNKPQDLRMFKRCPRAHFRWCH